jgi:hypothetical protein
MKEYIVQTTRPSWVVVTAHSRLDAIVRAAAIMPLPVDGGKAVIVRELTPTQRKLYKGALNKSPKQRGKGYGFWQ